MRLDVPRGSLWEALELYKSTVWNSGSMLDIGLKKVGLRCASWIMAWVSTVRFTEVSRALQTALALSLRSALTSISYRSVLDVRGVELVR
jgi:hypothetical protein